MSRKSPKKSPSSRKGPMDRCFDSQAIKLARAVFEQLNTSYSNHLLDLLNGGRFLELVDSAISPDAYSGSEEFRKDYLASSLMSKFPCFNLGIDRELEAQRRFLLAEGECTAASKRLRTCYVNGLRSCITPESILLSAQLKIARLLGPFSWDSAEPFFAFGPGATFTRPRREGDAYYKFRAKPCVTRDCAILAYTALHRVPLWYSHVVSLTGRTEDDIASMPIQNRLRLLFNIVPGNRVAFVPKDAKKDRTIAIEPTMNGYLQHGIGALIRRRLRYVGIDLNDQTRNQALAREGSITGALATVDLSAASDSVSLALCERLLPADWFEAVSQTRSSVGVLPSGEVVTYSKVSSMGNGYTFELESLLFWAISSAVVDALKVKERRVSVYGDDIILATDAVHTLGWILRFCGFSFNEEKTFVYGPFRESCGKHFFHGDDVTPFYVREDVRSTPRLIWFANQVRRWSALSWGLDGDMRPVYDLTVGLLPASLQKPSIPDGYGDYALFGDFDEVCPHRAPNGCDFYLSKMWVPIQKTWAPVDLPFLLRQLSFPCGLGDVQKLPSYAIIQSKVMGSDNWRMKRLRFVDDAFRPVHPAFANSRVWRQVTVAFERWSQQGPWLN